MTSGTSTRRWLRRRKPIAALKAWALVAAICGVAACSSFGIYKPTATTGNATISSPVPVVIQWTPNQTPNLKVMVDNIDQTAAFAITPTGATSSLVLSAGTHTIVATADIYDPLYQKTFSDHGSVTVNIAGPPSPSFTISAPASLSIPRGGSNNLAITLTPSCANVS